MIWKFSIDAMWLARQWVADGWRCWGYSYPEHVTSDQLKGWQELWTCLGMSWDVSKEVWDKTLAFGKPVWGHICPTGTAYTTAFGEGRRGVHGFRRCVFLSVLGLREMREGATSVGQNGPHLLSSRAQGPSYQLV